MQPIDFSLLSRINRDILDGLIVLDTKGTIIYTNPAAGQLMGRNLQIGSKYSSLLIDENSSVNDEFHQYLLDSVYDKRHTHHGELEYTKPNGEKHVFHILTSFLFGSEGTEKMGVVIQFSDITELNHTHKLHRNTAYLFIALLGILSVFNFISVIWMNMGKPFSSSIITILIEVVGFSLVLLLFRNFDLDWQNIGLRIKGCGKYIAIDAIVTALILAVMIIVKIYLRKNMILSPSEPFLHMDKWDTSKTFYPITVVLQEFLTRSLVHEGIRQVLPTKNADLIAIGISSLFFGAIHLHLGLAFMAGSALLLGVFGLVYTKQRSIWGLCIPHYVLGLAVSILWGF